MQGKTKKIPEGEKGDSLASYAFKGAGKGYGKGSGRQGRSGAKRSLFARLTPNLSSQKDPQAPLTR